jgi:peptide/nickel transport system permease protein
MGNYILKRLLQGIPVLFLITAIVFIVVYLIPGDAAMVVLGQGASAENLAAMRERMGLDKPMPVRYAIWLGEVLRGNLGTSLVYQRPVWSMVGHAFPITFYLTALAILLAVLISVPAGTVAALKRNTWIDLVVTVWAFIGVSIPGFWLGIMLVIVFGAQLQWVPLQGFISPGEDLAASLKTMALPTLTLGVFLSGPLTRYLRSSVLQTMAQEFVPVARAKGLAEQTVIARHILRNSLIPFVTVIGIQLGYLISGAVVVENVFALPGIGDLALSAIGNRDYPVIQGVVLVIATGFVLINIAVDVIYAALDPRLRIGHGTR